MLTIAQKISILNIYKDFYKINKLLKVLKLKKSYYYVFLKRKPSLQTENMAKRRNLIIQIFNDSNKVYGTRKIKVLLEKSNIFVSVKTISNDIKSLNLFSCYVKKFKPAKSKVSSEEKCVNYLKHTLYR